MPYNITPKENEMRLARFLQHWRKTMIGNGIPLTLDGRDSLIEEY
jgi:hypothetical protein